MQPNYSDKGVAIAPYNPQWPELYQKEAAVLQELIGDEIVQIDHFGSTSVLGMDAKPWIDILVQTESGVLSEQYEQIMKQNGYQKKVFPDRNEYMFMKGNEHGRTHNIHIAKKGGVFAESMLQFRDTLRADKKLAMEYAELKKELAQRFPDDRTKYYDLKIGFFQKVLGINTRYPGQQ